MIYPVFLEKGSDGWYVGVPDLLGCVSAGDSMQEALLNVREAIALHLEGMAEEGLQAPASSTIEVLRKDPDWADMDLWAVVEVPELPPAGKAVRLNITLNEQVLAKLDAASKTTGESRSGLLARATMDYLQRRVADKHNAPRRSRNTPATSSTKGTRITANSLRKTQARR